MGENVRVGNVLLTMPKIAGGNYPLTLSKPITVVQTKIVVDH